MVRLRATAYHIDIPEEIPKSSPANPPRGYIRGSCLSSMRAHHRDVERRRHSLSVSSNTMKLFRLLPLVLAACSRQPMERYGFVARLGNDTVSLESVSRRGNTVTSDEVDRFPRLRKRHTVVTLGPAGEIRRLVMEIETPSEPANERERRVVADVTTDSVLLTKRDGTGDFRWAFA